MFPGCEVTVTARHEHQDVVGGVEACELGLEIRGPEPGRAPGEQILAGGGLR